MRREKCLVCFADEHGVSVGLSKQRDGTEWYFVLLTELPRRVDEAHSGFAPIHYRNALEFIRHKIPGERLCRPARVLFVTPPRRPLRT